MWMKIDDGLHAHRKTRAVTRSHAEKARDSAPMGLWVLAGSWSARNNRDGWVPTEELDRFDDDWESLSKRLVHAGYWWPETRDGEDGYGFNDWEEWNNPDSASVSGTFGNHVRWHVNKGVAKPGCEHCPTEPDEDETIAPTSPRHRPDDRPDIGGESLRDHRPESLTQPIPKPKPNPNPSPEPLSRKRSQTDPPERFEEFWETYSHKVGKKKAETAYRQALKKSGVTPDLLIAAAAAYITYQIAEGKHPKFTKAPLTWLHGEHWRDERQSIRAPTSNVQRHLQLAAELAEREQGPRPPSPLQLGGNQ